MRVAINRNGMTTRDFNREMSVRVQAVKVPDQNIFTSDVVGPGGFDYEHPYQYSLQKMWLFQFSRSSLRDLEMFLLTGWECRAGSAQTVRCHIAQTFLVTYQLLSCPTLAFRWWDMKSKMWSSKGLQEMSLEQTQMILLNLTLHCHVEDFEDWAESNRTSPSVGYHFNGVY